MRQTRARAAGKRGFTLIELLVVVAIIALLISILMPSLARARELSKRTVCASNVKGIGLGFASYAAANSDAWPIPNHPKGSTTATQVNYQRAIGAKRGLFNDAAAGETFSGAAGEPGAPSADLYISTTRAFWMLVRSGNTPKSFTCPSATTDAPNTEDNPQTFWDFGAGDSVARNGSPLSTVALTPEVAKVGWSQISYGYQVPFSPNSTGTPGPNVDPDMALVSDKGPYSAYFEGGQTQSPVYTNAPDANSSPEEWKKYNSPNHGGYMDGEGQNVMYNDGHVEFFNSPTCGVSKDNIFTQWGTSNNPNQTQRAQGNQPLGTSPNVQLYPNGANDSLIYP